MVPLLAGLNNVPVVLDGVISSTREKPGYEGPLVAMNAMSRQ
ncbi:Myb-related protein B [Senna tora]|uniref:Myb-related protein B n=1 Tax=Senna tora TaxID=362788 RepID=A0A834WJF5_9FABA|nr:Myb-related protein B [Senna tora]